MTNLIPPDAKKAIVTEYWFRVVVMWCVMISFGLIVIAVLQVPTFILIKTHMGSYSDAFQSARAMSESFEESEHIIEEANKVAQYLASEESSVTLSEVVDKLYSIAGRAIAIDSIELEKSEGMLSGVAVRGVAQTREALADFSSDLESDPLFAEADLPFSNLAKDKDISFSITIVPATSMIE